ncbi:nitroreductase [soil metagenome]
MSRAASVSEALASRRSVRAFTSQDIDEKMLRSVIERAARAPSGGNLQPWHVYALKGKPLDEMRDLMQARLVQAPDGEGADGEGVDYRIYPSPMVSPYAERRAAFGNALYGSMHVAREDAARRMQWHHRNFRFFDAPAALFCYVDRAHGSPQWSDLGMYLMSLMLLLREEGLDSCPQECWARYATTVDRFIDPKPGLMLFCGMSIGYADREHPVNRFESTRAPVEEFATFMGFSGG